MNATRLLRMVLPAALAVVTAKGGFADGETQRAHVIQTVEPQFPTTVTTRELASGMADVVINVDADGKLADWLVASYTDEAFAAEAVRALKQWQYQPALLAGRPVGSLLELTFEFKAHLKVITTDASDPYHNLLASIVGPRVTHLLCRPGDLDRPVAALQTVAPPGVGALRGAGEGARVVVDFYVDRDGRIRMPVIMNAPHPVLAQATVDALSQWRFRPPTVAGQPVAVRVEQEFVFSRGT